MMFSQRSTRHPTQQLLTVMLHDMEIIVTKKRIKNINLRIDRQGVVKVSAPMRCSLQRIHDFLTEKEDWITTHVAKIKARPKQTPVTYTNNMQTNLIGNRSQQALEAFLDGQ